MVMALQRTLILLCFPRTAFAPPPSKDPPGNRPPKSNPGAASGAPSEVLPDVSDGFCVEWIEDVFRGADPEFILRQKKALEKYNQARLQQIATNAPQGPSGVWTNSMGITAKKRLRPFPCVLLALSQVLPRLFLQCFLSSRLLSRRLLHRRRL